MGGKVTCHRMKEVAAMWRVGASHSFDGVLVLVYEDEELLFLRFVTVHSLPLLVCITHENAKVTAQTPIFIFF